MRVRGLVAALRLDEVPLFAGVREVDEVREPAPEAAPFAAAAFAAEVVRRAAGLAVLGVDGVDPSPSTGVSAAGSAAGFFVERERAGVVRGVRDALGERLADEDVAADREVERRFGAGAPSASGAGSFVVT
ncbi:hypothetical protein GCM10027515_26430 [Schumannella luteola]|nr:hypothetical protein FJ656_15205 [Schumannella luteola]